MENEKGILIRSRIKIIDEQKEVFLESKHKYDYQCFKSKDGTLFFIDGGVTDCVRIGGDLLRIENHSVDTTQCFTYIRENYGKYFDKGVYKTLSQMRNKDIFDFLVNYLNYNPRYKTYSKLIKFISTVEHLLTIGLTLVEDIEKNFKIKEILKLYFKELEYRLY